MNPLKIFVFQDLLKMYILYHCQREMISIFTRKLEVNGIPQLQDLQWNPALTDTPQQRYNGQF